MMSVGILVALGSGCADPPDQSAAGCDTDGGTGAGDTDGVCHVPDPEPGVCGNPGFEDIASLSPPPTRVACGGVADGVIHYTAKIGLDEFGQRQAPGEPAPESFPSADVTVEACCSLSDGDSGVAADGCAYDCARAVCNRALARLAESIASDDPSAGGCDPLNQVSQGAVDNCRDRARQSLQAWFNDLSGATTYKDCLATAAANSDPNVDYWDPDIVANQVSLKDPTCDENAFGCLHNGALRVYCAVDTVEPQASETCDLAANPFEGQPEDPSGGGGGLVGPGTVDAGTTSWPVEVTGGRLRWSCDGVGCAVRLEALRVEVPGEVKLAPWLRVREAVGVLGWPLTGERHEGGMAVLGAVDGRLWVEAEVAVGWGADTVVLPVRLRWKVAGPAVLRFEEGSVRLVHVPLARDGTSLTLRSQALELTLEDG